MWPCRDGMELSDAERSVKLADADGFERLSSGSVRGHEKGMYTANFLILLQ